MKKLLIVDNSIVIINVLKDLFAEKNEFEVFIAKSLKEVQELISKKDFFTVIANTVLPDALDGELVELLDSKNIPTIVLSSNVDNEHLKFKNNKSIVDYILKDSLHGLETVYALVDLLQFIKGREVLVVDDSSVLATQIKEVLERLLLKVIIACDGEKAVSLLKKNPDISMVISDYNMPNMNGLQLTKKLRKEPKYANLPILIVSSETDDDLKINLFKNGANDYIFKPILEEELKAKIINIFSMYKQVEEIRSFNQIFDDNIISSSTDTKGVIKSVSTAFCHISGYSKEELIGKHHNIVRHPDMPSSVYKELWSTIKAENIWKGEVKNLRKDGTSYWVSAVIEPQYDSQSNLVGYFAVRQDITDKKRIYELSITDGLTSLFNRRHFNDIADTIVEKANRNNEVFAFLLLDIDNFKKYNDTYGHQEGDNVLINVSNSLKETFKRSDDLVFRLGGEEFGVLINTKTIEDAVFLTQEARVAIEKLGIEHSSNPPSNVITASFGLAIISLGVETHSLDFIYKKADDCLYKAKEGGRNTVEYIEL